MSRIHEVARRYAAAESVMNYGVSIFSVGDPAGAQLNAAIRHALFTLGEEPSEVWVDVLQAANALRWRRMTQPQPLQFQTQHQIIDYIVQRAKRIRTLVNDGALLDSIADAATTVGEISSPLGAVLLESIHEIGPEACVVVASKGADRAGLNSWLEAYGATVLVPSELNTISKAIECSYVVAPPTFMPSFTVTAPATPEVTFLTPSWFHNQTVPSSTLGAHAEGRILVKASVHTVGNTTEPIIADVNGEEVIDVYVPQPAWGARTPDTREPNSDEKEAWKVLLAGGLGLWLDDSDRIRTLDPRQPNGARVGYEAVSGVAPGTYLMLREGETERGAMYDQAISAIGAQASDIIATQAHWKKQLEARLALVGARRAATDLEQLGVHASNQVRAWTEPHLICPQRDRDFTLLLQWLGVQLQPTHDNAITLRRAVHKVSADLRKELETAASRADLRALERDGILRLELPDEGFRGMIVARVLARAPFTEIVSRHEIRVPFNDRSAKWLD